MIHTPPILVVEHMDEDYQTVKEAAEYCAVLNSISRAKSSETCLRRLQELTHTRQAIPAMVLLDLSTPHSDGSEALICITQDTHLREIPVVVLSGSISPRDLNFSYANGVNANHVQPVNHALHRLVLKKIFDYWLNSVVPPFDPIHLP